MSGLVRTRWRQERDHWDLQAIDMLATPYHDPSHKIQEQCTQVWTLLADEQWPCTRTRRWRLDHARRSGSTLTCDDAVLGQGRTYLLL